jgi:hypothetical protein
MKLQVRDAVSYGGHDYLVEGVVSYQSGAASWQLARAVDGDAVLWVEPQREDGRSDGRLLVLREVRDLEMAVPPPPAIAYHDLTYVQRFASRMRVALTGRVPERANGSLMVWRYRAAGDLYLQLEEAAGRIATLAGESVHRGMIEVLPGP